MWYIKSLISLFLVSRSRLWSHDHNSSCLWCCRSTCC